MGLYMESQTEYKPRWAYIWVGLYSEKPGTYFLTALFLPRLNGLLKNFNEITGATEIMALSVFFEHRKSSNKRPERLFF